MRKPWLLVIGLLFLIVLEISKVYFIMPFPGSQHNDTISVAYFIDNYIWLLRIIGLALVIAPLMHYLSKGKWWQKTILVATLLLYGVIAYAFNFKFLADKMFYQPKEKIFAGGTTDTTNKDKLVIGVAIGNEAKAYPIEIIGYHHQVKDTVGGKPIMVTYCTVCRTGRVYSPFVNGKYEVFRLVGMDHFNAMFEDATTKSWWQQATGKAITGNLKGTQLPEIASSQMRLGDWLALHPDSKVLQPDSNFKNKYDDLAGYDEGTLKSSLEKRDSASWAFKSWVVGLSIYGQSKAYDWNELASKKLIEDTLGNVPVALVMAPNGKTFYALNRNLNDQTLHLSYDTVKAVLTDAETHSTWALSGACLEGPSKGYSLKPVQAYQEFWHSWQTFHPGTKKYGQ
jgi:hypothetical protein